MENLKYIHCILNPLYELMYINLINVHNSLMQILKKSQTTQTKVTLKYISQGHSFGVVSNRGATISTSQYYGLVLQKYGTKTHQPMGAKH